MTEGISLDGRTLVGVANDDAGEVSDETTFTVEQTGDRISARYAGGSIVEGHLLGTIDDGEWDVRYVQLHENGETATGHSVGEISVLEDGRVRIDDEWEWDRRTAKVNPCSKKSGSDLSAEIRRRCGGARSCAAKPRRRARDEQRNERSDVSSAGGWGGLRCCCGAGLRKGPCGRRSPGEGEPSGARRTNKHRRPKAEERSEPRVTERSGAFGEHDAETNTHKRLPRSSVHVRA
ncbi:hypothetical protein L593_10320 [Salinarchaeum sp. Harcht-Bsk1]|nr:hypothetical protein L593_10320 [Salinarchaeum sp. Harcht-Bsk1]